MKKLKDIDPELADAIKGETERLEYKLELIASEIGRASCRERV